MVRVCVWCVVQNHRLGEISAQTTEIFDVMSEDASTVVLIQTMSARKKMNMFKPFVSVTQVNVLLEKCVSVPLRQHVYVHSPIKINL